MNMQTITCHYSGKTIEVKTTSKGNPKLPRGWKRIDEQIVSKEEFEKRYVLRSVTCRIVSPNLTGNPQEMKAAWELLNAQLKEAWEKSTEAANWAVKRLWSNDVTRQPGQKKCPEMPPIYLYEERDWTGWSESAGALLRTIEQTYRRRRFDIVHVGSAAVPNVKYPYPYPVHNASWKLEQMEGGEVVFSARLPSERVSVRLKTKDKSGSYVMSSLKHLIENPELRGQASIIKKKDGIAVSLIGYFPRATRANVGEMIVRTDSTSFLVAFDKAGESAARIATINGDWIRRKLAGHAAGLQRWREDQSAEKRANKRESRKSAEDMQLACDKMQNRVNSFISESCAQIVGCAVRRKLACIVFDDTERSYFRDFPWNRLKTRLQATCDREGIILKSPESTSQPIKQPKTTE